jgi:anthranilate phosphoribosyltransferase
MDDVVSMARSGATLTEDQAWAVFRAILGGSVPTEGIAEVLTRIAARGETVDELVGAARAMRESVERVPVDAAWAGQVIDTCGTGGAPKAFNISTGAALIAAGAGVRVAKHGNRSRTGRGSAEVLMALGVNVDASPAVQARCLRDAGVCFSFAIHHHPAMRFAAEARRSIAGPTIFNLLGPLTNPAGATRQMVGVFGADKVERVARALARLGAHRAMVVHGEDGMDEMTTTAMTMVAHVERGAVRMERIDARDFGIARADPASLVAASVEESAAIVRGILAGEPGPRADIAVWNAAGAILVAEAAADLASALARARAAVASGAAAGALDALAAVSRG